MEASNGKGGDIGGKTLEALYSLLLPSSPLVSSQVEVGGMAEFGNALCDAAFKEWINKALEKFVSEHERSIHDIVEEIIQRHKMAQGKGLKSLKSAAPSDSERARDPRISPKAADIRSNATYNAGPTRSFVEPMKSRKPYAYTVADLFLESAAACKAAVETIVSRCKSNKMKFFDSDFYFDSKKNLYPDGSPADCTVTVPDGAARLSDLFPGAPLFRDGVSFDDLQQGAIGDCFLIGAVSALAADSPKNVSELIVAHSVEWGVYGVCLFECGEWEWVIVDDFVATREERSGAVVPMYASSCDNGELWPMVLEKAFAKMHYNWDTIDGGWAREAIVEMTGGLDSVFDLYGKDKGMTFQRFKELCDDEYTVLACAVGDHVEQTGEQGRAGEQGVCFGLMAGHQYSVIRAHKTKDGAEFVQVRNPWGNDAEWKGPYSDNSKEWEIHGNHKAELRPVFRDDGMFWMPWEHFRKYFTDIDVVRTFPDNYRILTMFAGGEELRCARNTFLLEVFHEPTSLSIAGGQDDPKMEFGLTDHRKQRKPYNEINLSVCSLRERVARFENVEAALSVRVCAVRSRARAVSHTTTLNPGLYSISLVVTPPDCAVFLRVIGPADADYKLSRLSDLSDSLQIGECVPVQQPTAATPPPSASRGHADPSAPLQQPLASGSGSKDAASNDLVMSLRKELEAATQQLKKLEKKCASQESQIETLSTKLSSAARPADAVPVHKTKLPRERLNMSEASWRDGLERVFSEIAGPSKTLDPESALSALRLVITMGGGMDEYFYNENAKIGNQGPITLMQFCALADRVVSSWPVLQ